MAEWPTADDFARRLGVGTSTAGRTVDHQFAEECRDAAVAALSTLTLFGESDPVPADLRHCALVLSHRLHTRLSSPQGVTGAGPDGSAIYIARTDPDVSFLLRPYMTYPIAGVGLIAG